MTDAPTAFAAELAAASSDLCGGLGYFWESVFEGREFIDALSRCTSDLSAQTYQRFSELAAGVGHATVPTYARSRWRFVTLRDADSDTGRRLAVRVDNATSAILGASLHVGGYRTVDNYVGYPFEHTESVQVAIVDNIANPKHVLLPGADFVIEEGTILFRTGSDPFTLGFPVRTVSADGQEYREVALWCRDAYTDDELPYRFAGYAVGVDEPTSAWYSRYINALWALAQSGGSEAALAAYVYAALDVPYTTAEETVEYVGELETGFGVITNKVVYRIAALSDTGLAVGDIVPAYSPITNIAQLGSGRDWGTLGNLVLPLEDNTVRGTRGVSAGTALSTITYAGADSAGNPRLRFKLHGTDADVEAFWTSVDAYCVRNGIDQRTMLAPYLYDYRPETAGAVWGSISPASFFVDYYYGNSAKYVVVDVTRLTAHGLTGLYRLSDCDKYLPPGVRLAITAAGEAEDAYEPVAVSEASDYALEVVYDSMQGATDSVSAVWVPICKGGSI